MDTRELLLRREIMLAFAATGSPPRVDDRETLDTLAEHHVVALDEAGDVLMAHPFAAHHSGARVDAGGRTWWGNCAWDALGITAALGLRDATVTSDGMKLEIRGGRPEGDALFHVAVPARQWWEDIAFT